jgi:hypothetical protein
LKNKSRLLWHDYPPTNEEGGEVKISTDLLERYIDNPEKADSEIRKVCSVPDDKYYSVSLWPAAGIVTIDKTRTREVKAKKISKSDINNSLSTQTNDMKANKITVTVIVEVLSIDCVPGLLAQASEQINNEFHNGQLIADDGDTITWNTKSKPVEL